MPWSLKRYYGAGNLHFITCSCYRRVPFLGSSRRRTLFLDLLEQTRQRYGSVVAGYAVMPEHFHLLISEPEKGTPSTVMQVLKQGFAQRVLRAQRRSRSASQALLWEPEPQHIWQARFYDFTSGARASGSRSCATCMRTRSSAVWCWNPGSGRGAASAAMFTGSRDG